MAPGILPVLKHGQDGHGTAGGVSLRTASIAHYKLFILNLASADNDAGEYRGHYEGAEEAVAQPFLAVNRAARVESAGRKPTLCAVRIHHPQSAACR